LPSWRKSPVPGWKGGGVSRGARDEVNLGGAIEGLERLVPPILDAADASAYDSISKGERLMTWEKPEFVEIKMDCEINSYQDDFQRDDFNGVES
jgi:hypothetical protein